MRLGMGQDEAGSGGGNRKSALLLPNWFEDSTEYRLKKALVREGREDKSPLLMLLLWVMGCRGFGCWCRCCCCCVGESECNVATSCYPLKVIECAQRRSH
ncbi:unnamed protein product [Ectocarpus fasciculatus]